MAERDGEQGEEREDDHIVGRPEDDRAITLSDLLGETAEEASRRPIPQPPQLHGSPRRSLLLVAFSAVVVACLVALGALATHSGGFPGINTDQRTSVGDAPDPA